MKNLKKVLALVLAVVMIMSVVTVASAKTYTDVKATDNYADAIDALSSLKILDGFLRMATTIPSRLRESFTRAQAAKIVAIVHNAATNGAIKRPGRDSPVCTAMHRTRSWTATTAGLCPSSTTAASPAWLTA